MRSAPAALSPILAVNFVGTLGFSIVLPFLVFLVTRWGGNALVYGVVGATYSAFQLVGAPLLGRWSDRYGRRKILLLSQAGTLLSWGVFLVAFALPEEPLLRVDSGLLGAFAVTPPLLVVFLARALDGLTGGNVSVANAYLADISTESNRSANYGKMAVAANLGFVLGPAIAGILGGTRYGELLPVLAAAAISGMATALIAFRLPESKPAPFPDDYRPHSVRKVFGQEQADCVGEREQHGPTTVELLRLPCVARVLSIYFLVMLGFNVFYVAFPMQAVHGLAWTVIRTGIFFSVLSLFMALVQGPVLSRLSGRVPDRTLAVIGGAILSASFPCFLSTHTAVLYAGALLLALGNGLMWPSILSLLARAAGEVHQGAVQGLAGSLGALASILGLVAGGLIFTAVGPQVFLGSAALILMAALLAARQVPAGARSSPE